MTGPGPGGKSPAALRTISEVSAELQLPQHILRFWETRFPELKPMQRGGNRRYYRPSDVALCRTLKRLLHEEGYTVKGVRRLIEEKGVRSLVEERDPAAGSARHPPPPAPAPAPAPAPREASTRATLARVAGRLRAALEQARA